VQDAAHRAVCTREPLQEIGRYRSETRMLNHCAALFVPLYIIRDSLQLSLSGAQHCPVHLPERGQASYLTALVDVSQRQYQILQKLSVPKLSLLGHARASLLRRRGRNGRVAILPPLFTTLHKAPEGRSIGARTRVRATRTNERPAWSHTAGGRPEQLAFDVMMLPSYAMDYSSAHAR
jgi:hypothetical protein